MRKRGSWLRWPRDRYLIAAAMVFLGASVALGAMQSGVAWTLLDFSFAAVIFCIVIAVLLKVSKKKQGGDLNE